MEDKDLRFVPKDEFFVALSGVCNMATRVKYKSHADNIKNKKNLATVSDSVTCYFSHFLLRIKIIWRKCATALFAVQCPFNALNIAKEMLQQPRCHHSFCFIISACSPAHCLNILWWWEDSVHFDMRWQHHGSRTCHLHLEVWRFLADQLIHEAHHSKGLILCTNGWRRVSGLIINWESKTEKTKKKQKNDGQKMAALDLFRMSSLGVITT